jgi:PAS domain-containing protein
MKQNSWLAIDVGTAPMVRAQELRFAWERWVDRLAHDLDPDDDDGDDPEILRTPIADSWRRSFAAGVDPAAHRLAPVVADEGEVIVRWQEHPLARAAPLIRECLAATAEEAGYLLVVSDASGVLLLIEGAPAIRLRAADHMNFAEGTLWSEPGAGTNAIGTALAVDHAVQVFGPEHFSEDVQRWTCSAAPVHDPDTGEPIGVIDLTGDFSTVHPASLAVATATARAVETSLRLEQQQRDAEVCARYGNLVAVAPDARALVAPTGRPLTALPAAWRVSGRLAIPPGGGELQLPSGTPAMAEPLGGAAEAFVVRLLDRATARGARPICHLAALGRDRALLEIDGRQVQLRRRLAEILVLLSMTPHGLSAEALCAELHGDGGSPSSVRVEVSRLRKLLGPWIDTERYRLTCEVETDARRVERLLGAGAVRGAAEAYAGPLLPGSDAPGIVAAREHLAGWLRHAVMTSDDTEAVWAWVNTDSGREDIGAWKRVLAGLEFRDPRRALAAARVGELRRSFS